MTAMIFFSTCAFALIYIGTWKYFEKDNWALLIVCTALAFLGIFCGNEYSNMETERYYNTIITEKDAEIESLNETGIYYLGAEIVEQKALSNGSYKINFIDVENGNVYAWIDDSEYFNDVPYLLTMDGKGTEDVTDDEIVVVWMDME